MYIYAKKEGMWMEGSQEVRKKRKMPQEIKRQSLDSKRLSNIKITNAINFK